jgi:HD-GYP domain-containing protein (c-di-GMP phosphodiesterase class II)
LLCENTPEKQTKCHATITRKLTKRSKAKANSSTPAASNNRQAVQGKHFCPETVAAAINAHNVYEQSGANV